MIGPSAPSNDVVDADEFRRLADDVDLVVLDVHGVVLNRPWIPFLHDTGTSTGEGGLELERRWRRDLRLPCWEGRLTDTELWARLAPTLDANHLRVDLERRFRPGPLYGAIAQSDSPIWLLSNHRTHWLLPRLERFDLTDRFERIIVSDQIGAAKPDPRIFADVIAETTHRRLCFVDDQEHNTTTARSLGIPARRLAATQ